MPHIFDTFSQEDNSITREFGGSGLGLAIVHDLVELMDGSISVKSTLGKGTQFTLTIPFEQLSESEAEELISAKSVKTIGVKMECLRVLLAEDNPVNALIAQSFLEKLGHNVTLVKNGQLAVDAICESDPFDLIFMDVHMPVMDGISATVCRQG